MRERGRESEREINSIYSDDEIWCKLIWCIITAVLDVFLFVFVYMHVSVCVNTFVPCVCDLAYMSFCDLMKYIHPSDSCF